MPEELLCQVLRVLERVTDGPPEMDSTERAATQMDSVSERADSVSERATYMGSCSSSVQI